MKLTKKISERVEEALRDSLEWEVIHGDYSVRYTLARYGKRYDLMYLCGTTPRLTILPESACFYCGNQGLQDDAEECGICRKKIRV